MKIPTVNDVRNEFKSLAKSATANTESIKMWGRMFFADESYIFGDQDSEYAEAMIGWYYNGSTNIDDIYEYKGASKEWQSKANKHGEINSNYGHLIFSDKYNNQFLKVLTELSSNPQSRKATMIYNRPSIWEEYNENGNNDFINLNDVNYQLYGKEVKCVAQMNQLNVVDEYMTTYLWLKEVLDLVCAELYDYKPGEITIQTANLYMNKSDFHFIDE
jgi:thymidylate synthase